MVFRKPITDKNPTIGMLRQRPNKNPERHALPPLSVYNSNDRFDVKLQKMVGWFGVNAAGDFGRVEGWIRIDDVPTGPADFDSKTTKGKTNLCGRSRDGKIFSA